MKREQSQFVEWLRKNLSVVPTEKTLHNKARLLLTLVRTYGLDLENPDPHHVIEQLARADISARTAKTYKTAFKQWLQFKGIEITKDLENGLRHRSGEIRRKIHPKDLVTREEVLDIVEHTSSPALRAYYMVLYDSGARPGALCKLNVCDVTQDSHGYVLHINRAKTDQSKRSIRLLDPVAIRHFEVWWSIHPRRIDSETPLFINRYGNRFRVDSVLNVLRQYHNKRLDRGTGTNKAPLSLYLFRKSRATQLLKERKFSEIEVKMRLGHKKGSRMMEKYYAILDEDDQAEAELRYLGIAAEEKKRDEPIMCPNCGAPNETDSLRCVRCKLPMSEDKAIQVQKAAVESFQSLLSDPETLKASFESLLSDPDVLSLLASAVADSLVQEREKRASSIAETSDRRPS